MFNFFSGYVNRIISTITHLAIIKQLSNKKLHEVLIIYAFIFISASFIQIIFLLPTNNLGWDVAYTFLLVQLLSFFVIMVVYIKAPLHRLLNKIENELMLKLFLFTLATLISITHFYINFEYTSSYLVYCLLIISVTLIGLYQTYKKVYYYTNDVPKKVHDTTNILASLQEAVFSMTDIDDIRLEINAAIDMLGIDTSVDDIEIGEYNKNILSIIDKVKKIR